MRVCRPGQRVEAPEHEGGPWTQQKREATMNMQKERGRNVDVSGHENQKNNPVEYF